MVQSPIQSITGIVSDLAKKKDLQQVAQDVANLPWEKWQKEIRLLWKKYELDKEKTEKLIMVMWKELTTMLARESIKEDLQKTKQRYESYKKLFDANEAEDFADAWVLIDAIDGYITKVNLQVKDRLKKVLLARPWIEVNMPIIQKVIGEVVSEKSEKQPIHETLPETFIEDVVTGKAEEEKAIEESIDITESDIAEVFADELPIENDASEDTLEEVEKSVVKAKKLTAKDIKDKQSGDFVLRTVEILEADNFTEEEKQTLIVDAYKELTKKERITRKQLYIALWLGEELASSIKEINIDLLKNYLAVSKNAGDAVAKEKLISISNEYIDAAKKKKQEQVWEVHKLKKSNIKVVGKVDLDKIEKKPKAQPAKKVEEEIMQKPTTDPLDLVGEKMKIQAFLSKVGLSDYDEIESLVRGEAEVPAIYFGEGDVTKDGKSRTHYFTIGAEQKWNNSVFINVSTRLPVGEKIVDDSTLKEVFPVRLIDIDSDEKINTKPRRQSKQVRWVLVRKNKEKNNLSNNSSHNTIGDIAKITRKQNKQ